jgi:hypothetical protein
MSIAIVRDIYRDYDTLFLMAALFCLCFITCNGAKHPAYQFAAMAPPSDAYCEFDSLLDARSQRQDSFNRAFDIALMQAKKDRVPVIYQAPRDTFSTRIKITRISPRFGEEQRK